MPLTPEDVQNKEFTTVRLREGYDMQEVDEFLDEVEAELSRMHRENEELRDKLAAVTRGGGLASAAGPLGAPQRPAEGQGPKPPPSAAPTPAPTVSTTGVQPSDAAAKVLALAQKTADELVADSKLEADRLLADARQRAEKIDSESSAKVAKIEHDARTRADSLEREAQQRHQQPVPPRPVQPLRAARCGRWLACSRTTSARSGRRLAAGRSHAAQAERQAEVGVGMVRLAGEPVEALVDLYGENLGGDGRAVLAEGQGQFAVGLPGELDPVGHVVAAGLPGLLNQADDLGARPGRE